MKTRWMAGLLAVAIATPALAVDGVVEINQARAMAGGITPTDGPGFPITLGESGSYRLTGDLTVAAGVQGIYIEADNVTLDLNGFTVTGGGGAIADGIGILAVKNVEIRNGTVRGFSRYGVFGGLFVTFARVIGVRATANGNSGIEIQGQGQLVDGCTAFANGSSGIRVGDGSLITNSVARGNSSFGLSMGLNSGYRSNVLTGNNGGDANPQASNGQQLGTNVCGSDLVCP